MPRYASPRCVNVLPSGNPCGHEMRPLGERHPLIGQAASLANPRRPLPGTHEPGVWVFQCGYCGAVRAADTGRLDRYFERIR